MSDPTTEMKNLIALRDRLDARLLDRLTDAVEPILLTRARPRPVAGFRETPDAYWTFEYDTPAGVLLIDEREWTPSLPGSRQGLTFGRALYYAPSTRQWYEHTRHGEWSNVGGETSRWWEADRTISTGDVVRDYKTVFAAVSDVVLHTIDDLSEAFDLSPVAERLRAIIDDLERIERERARQGEWIVRTCLDVLDALLTERAELRELSGTYRWHDDTWVVEHGSIPAVLLVDERREEPNPADPTRGTYAGRALYYAACTGEWLEHTRFGDWALHPEETTSWTESIRPLSLSSVIAEYGTDTIIAALTRVVENAYE